MRFLTCLCLPLAAVSLARAADAPFRPPAVPLVTSDPYLSIWSEADKLTDDVTRHWTHRPHSLVSLIRVDGAASRLMGNDPTNLPSLPQVSLVVTPTRTIYEFEDSKVHVTLAFLTPLLPEDLDVFARPVTYLTWTVRSVDGNTHQVSLYDSTSSELAVNKTDEKVKWGRQNTARFGVLHDLTLLYVGTDKQPVLGSSGDNHRIDWGYAYAAARTKQAAATACIGGDKEMVESFVRDGELPGEDDSRMPRPVSEDQPVMAFEFDLGNVGAKPASRQVMVGYDEIAGIKYFGENLVPYWRRNGATPATLFRDAQKDYPRLERRCAEFDRDLTADLTQAGGAEYAQIAALAYRQAAAACGLVADSHKEPLYFTKENTSNGDIATVDVFYPMDPVWILLSPALAKATVVPVLSYAASWHWKFPNAPHDLGTYPIAAGRDDGGEGMPVEESGNMLLLCDAICQADGAPGFVAPWWPQLTQWAHYLEQYGLDPENQLCTDDFMGHLAHNANLSIKAILGLAAYGDLCRMRGEDAAAGQYADMARKDARHWITAAGEGNHFKLAFDKTNSWSQKYNLVWDRILGLHIFPPSVAATEVAFYKTVLQPYGIPLDSRTHLTKTDWSVWSASLAENNSDFETFIDPIYNYLDRTPKRLPLADAYYTDKLNGDVFFHARPVVGGIFIRMLDDRAMWMKWARRREVKVGDWEALPGAAPK